VGCFSVVVSRRHENRERLRWKWSALATFAAIWFIVACGSPSSSGGGASKIDTAKPTDVAQSQAALSLPGQQKNVTVDIPIPAPLSFDTPAIVNQAPVSDRYEQVIGAPGRYQFAVTVKGADGTVDSTLASVTIKSCSPTSTPAVPTIPDRELRHGSARRGGNVQRPRLCGPLRGLERHPRALARLALPLSPRERPSFSARVLHGLFPSRTSASARAVPLTRT
jgi:hypothetical protein